MFSVREVTEADIKPLADYWYKATPEFIRSMGADPAKMHSREAFEDNIHKQIGDGYQEKRSYCIIWLLEGKPVGHNNVNEIIFGEHAHMHLHMWKPDERKRGLGPEFIKLALPHFFKNLELKVLYCEPSADNAAPNKALPKAGFEFVKEYMTVPSVICAEQMVKQWRMTVEMFKQVRA